MTIVITKMMNSISFDTIHFGTSLHRNGTYTFTPCEPIGLSLLLFVV